MGLRGLAMVVVCCGAWTTYGSQAALVMPVYVADAQLQPTSGAADTDLVLHTKALGPGRQGEALCADRSLCQGWNDPFGEVGPSQPSGLLGRTTLLANTALVAIGLLWIVITRRSLRGAQAKPRRS